MAEVKVNRESSGQQNQPAQRGQAEVAPRGEFPGMLSFNPRELFSMNPIDLMRKFTNEMDRFFGATHTGGAGEIWAPAVEVRQEGNHIRVSAELPGLAKDDVRVEIADGGLVIQGERRREHKEQRSGYYRSERSYGRFYRQIPLPEDAQIDQATAQFNSGVLEIIVPAPAQQHRRREIPIETEAKAKTSGGGAGA